MLYDFEAIWNGHMGLISTRKHRIKLFLVYTKAANFALYLAGPKIREYGRNMIKKMLLEIAVEPAYMKQAAPIVFVHKKIGYLSFSVDCQNLNRVTSRDV